MVKIGCDIHLYAEKKVKGKWICINPLVWEIYSTEPYTERVLEEIDVGRDYELFGFLAGVRTTQKVNIGDPKGFPEDASAEVKQIYLEWGEDAHSGTYATLSELKEKLSGSITVKGMMPKTRLEKLTYSINKGNPDWELLYPYFEWASLENYESFKFEVPIEYQFKGFITNVVKDILQEHTWNKDEQKHSEDEVRIVFWFDN